MGEAAVAGKAGFVAALRQGVGQTGDRNVARDPVNQAMIRHWCDAMEDLNPVYTDPTEAAKSVHGEIVAPPAMLQAWSMRGLEPRREAGSYGADPAGRVYAALDTAGYTSVVATNSDHEYPRYLRIGDELSGQATLTDVSEEKRTGLGIGHFVTSETEYRNQDDEYVGKLVFRILKFKPGTGRHAQAAGDPAAAPAAPEAPPSARERPPRREQTLCFAEVEEGAELAPCPIPITTTLIVATAIASRDYQDVHHDKELAITRGSPDIFMNILTSSGMCARYVSDWAGPEAIMKRLAIRLGAPNYPHDTMTMTGSVLARRAGPGGQGGTVELGLRGHNRLGDHVTGTLELELP